jgi:hypothetical protein
MCMVSYIIYVTARNPTQENSETYATPRKQIVSVSIPDVLGPQCCIFSQEKSLIMVTAYYCKVGRTLACVKTCNSQDTMSAT